MTQSHSCLFFLLCCAQSLSCVWLFVTPWTVAFEAPLSMRIFQARILTGVGCHCLHCKVEQFLSNQSFLSCCPFFWPLAGEKRLFVLFCLWPLMSLNCQLQQYPVCYRQGKITREFIAVHSLGCEVPNWSVLFSPSFMCNIQSFFLKLFSSVSQSCPTL